MLTLEVDIDMHKMVILNEGHPIQEYTISTAKNGVGEQRGSEQTPCGWHVIRAKVGAHCPPNTVFVSRRPTGEIFNPNMRTLFPERDWILTRILWLSGLEVGKNRLGLVDTMRRYIYIHGAPDTESLGVPGSIGCIRMGNRDIVELFDLVPAGTVVDIA